MPVTATPQLQDSKGTTHRTASATRASTNSITCTGAGWTHVHPTLLFPNALYLTSAAAPGSAHAVHESQKRMAFEFPTNRPRRPWMPAVQPQLTCNRHSCGTASPCCCCCCSAAGGAITTASSLESLLQCKLWMTTSLPHPLLLLMLQLLLADGTSKPPCCSPFLSYSRMCWDQLLSGCCCCCCCCFVSALGPGAALAAAGAVLAADTTR